MPVRINRSLFSHTHNPLWLKLILAIVLTALAFRSLSLIKRIDLRTVFSTFDMDKLGKIRHSEEKKRLQFNKIVKFECDLLKTNDDLGLHSPDFLLRFVWWRARIQTAVKFRGFEELYLHSQGSQLATNWSHMRLDFWLCA